MVDHTHQCTLQAARWCWAVSPPSTWRCAQPEQFSCVILAIDHLIYTLECFAGGDVLLGGFPSKRLALRAPPGGTLIARSDANGEDLDDFAGAGLYDRCVCRDAMICSPLLLLFSLTWLAPKRRADSGSNWTADASRLPMAEVYPA